MVLGTGLAVHIRNAWVYSSSCLVILLLLKLAPSTVPLRSGAEPRPSPDPKIPPAPEITTGKNGMDSPALPAKSKEISIQYTTTQEDHFSIAASK
uniref:Uncharacterized protein n=1 Tax=Ditylenchus dipsaci TaxID=166011 RepID=A0A915CWB8_9BILA